MDLGQVLIDSEVFERVERMELPFNRYGLDPYGISQERLAEFFTVLGWFYKNYFRVSAYGTENIPERGRVMLVGNHSGGIPMDGGMVISSAFFELEPPRLAQGMVDKFANRWPVVSSWFSRVGQFTGLPDHAIQLLNRDRMLLVFPEGSRGTGKLYKDRYKLVRFGTGFMRLALETDTPIVPFSFIGGEEALPTVFHLKKLARLVGAPYIPISPYLLPIPMPVQCQIYFGEPMRFDGDGSEEDSTIESYVGEVKEQIRGLISYGRERRSSLFLEDDNEDRRR
jgi:1-acyl-sn-glycerol-3-phosphate acyltransferase